MKDNQEIHVSVKHLETAKLSAEESKAIRRFCRKYKLSHEETEGFIAAYFRNQELGRELLALDRKKDD